MKPKIRVNGSIICPLTLLLIVTVSATAVRAQCTAAPIAAAACTGGNGAATNGITINGTPGMRQHTLRVGDRFTIGSYDFYFERR